MLLETEIGCVYWRGMGVHATDVKRLLYAPPDDMGIKSIDPLSEVSFQIGFVFGVKHQEKQFPLERRMSLNYGCKKSGLRTLETNYSLAMLPQRLELHFMVRFAWFAV